MLGNALLFIWDIGYYLMGFLFFEGGLVAFGFSLVF